MSAPRLEEIIELSLDSALGEVYTAQPGVVVSFDKTQLTVSVQPLFKERYLTEDGKVGFRTRPVIPGIPVCFQGAGAYRATFPIKKGDTVLLVHLIQAKDSWQFAQSSNPVEISDVRRHDITDCVAIPGVLSRAEASGASARVADDGWVFHTGGKVYLGGGPATKPVVRTSDLETTLASLLSNGSVLQTFAANISAKSSYDTALAGGIPAVIAAALAAYTAARAATSSAISSHFSSTPAIGSNTTEST